MKKNYLFPNSFKIVGLVIAIIALVAFIGFVFSFNDITFKMPALIDMGLFGVVKFFCMAEAGWLTVILPVFIIGLIFIGFSKEKIEDEFVKSIREQSLVWATYTSAILLIIFTFTIYGVAYGYVIYSIFSLFLILFIIKFRIELRRSVKGGEK